MLKTLYQVFNSLISLKNIYLNYIQYFDIGYGQRLLYFHECEAQVKDFFFQILRDITDTLKQILHLCITLLLGFCVCIGCPYIKPCPKWEKYFFSIKIF